MNTEKLKELGFTKRNCWSGSDDYYKEQDGFNYTYIVKKDTDLFQESFIQYYDEAIYINTTDDFLKVIQSDNPWSLALKIGDKA